MKYVNRVVGRDGVPRLYFRKAGMPSVPLKSPMPEPGQEEGSDLAREVAALIAIQPPKAAPRTLRAALRAYELESPDFANLAASTRRSYLAMIKELDEDFGDLHISTFNAAYLMKLRTTWAKRGYRTPALLLNVLRNALLPHIIGGAFDGNDPFAMIPGVRRPHDLEEPHRIWPEDVVIAVIAAAVREGRFGIARGVALGRYAGARRGDIVKMAKSARRAGRIAWLSGKRKVPVNMEEDPALAAMITGTPDAKASTLLVYNLSGLAYTESGFHQELTGLVAKLFKAGAIDSDAYTAHGLRHTFGVEGALAGWSDATGMAMMGHSSPSSFAIYRRQADRIRMADGGSAQLRAMRELSTNGGLQNDLQNICKTGVEKQAKPRRKGSGKTT